MSPADDSRTGLRVRGWAGACRRRTGDAECDRRWRICARISRRQSDGDRRAPAPLPSSRCHHGVAV